MPRAVAGHASSRCARAHARSPAPSRASSAARSCWAWASQAELELRCRPGRWPPARARAAARGTRRCWPGPIRQLVARKTGKNFRVRKTIRPIVERLGRLRHAAGVAVERVRGHDQPGAGGTCRLRLRVISTRPPGRGSKSVAGDDRPAVFLEHVGDLRLLDAVEELDGPVELVEGGVGGLSRFGVSAARSRPAPARPRPGGDRRRSRASAVRRP